MTGLVYSSQLKIPLFKIICNPDSGEVLVEYLNIRNKGCTERINVIEMVIYLMREEAKMENLEKMIYTPELHIPLGVLHRDSIKGTYYLEVKFKKKKEVIDFPSYVSLMLNPDVGVLKAS